jgi:hypothetical protein
MFYRKVLVQMSEQAIGQKTVKARKKHVCHWCGSYIFVGDKYERWAWVDGGDISTVKSHVVCFKYAMRVQEVEGEPVWFDYDGYKPADEYEIDRMFQ